MDRFKFRVFCKSRGDYVEKMFDLTIYYDGRLVEYDGLEQNMDNHIIEQCTGLKDKNDNLIYEGDILLCERKIVDGATGAEIHYKSSGVVQRDKNGKYFIEGKDWYGSDITFYNECAEIIGNIHEQKDNK